MLKGIPDSPTPQNLPGVPIDISLANWWGLDSCLWRERAARADLCVGPASKRMHACMCLSHPSPPALHTLPSPAPYRNGDVQYYAKIMTEAELAEATAAMTWLQEPSSDGLSAGAIAGIAIGAAAAAILAVAAAVFVVRRRRRRPVLDAEAAMRAIKVGMPVERENPKLLV